MSLKAISETQKKVKVQLSISEDVLKLIDEDARANFLSRSGWVVKASLKMLEKTAWNKVDDFVMKK